MGNMNTISPAYVAGLVDGEGCITVMANRRRFRYPVFYMGMSVKALPILTMVQREYGGSLKQARAATQKWSAAMTLTITGNSLVHFLETIRPHLILKAEQCSMALILAYQIRNQRGRYREPIWTPRFAAAAQAMADQIYHLNRKGPTKE